MGGWVQHLHEEREMVCVTSQYDTKAFQTTGNWTDWEWFTTGGWHWFSCSKGGQRGQWFLDVNNDGISCQKCPGNRCGMLQTTSNYLFQVSVSSHEIWQLSHEKEHMCMQKFKSMSSLDNHKLSYTLLKVPSLAAWLGKIIKTQRQKCQKTVIL